MTRPKPPVSPVAVVLAAGMGTRLRAVQEKPKGFVEIAGEPIIARSLRALRAAGIEEFVFVVGWRAEAYRAWCAGEAAAGAGVRVCCVENADYASTGSLRSLLLGAAEAGGREVLVVESDLLYEPRAPRALLAAPGRDVILISGFTDSGDEVWAYADEGAPGRLRRLTKQRERRPGATAPAGELVGLTRLSGAALAELAEVARGLPAGAHYEDGLNAIAATRPLALHKEPDLAWCEIDDAAHLARARAEVWPRVSAALAVEKLS